MNGIDEALKEYQEMRQSRSELHNVFDELQSTIEKAKAPPREVTMDLQPQKKLTKRQYFNALVSHLPEALANEIGAPPEMDEFIRRRNNESTI